MFIVIDNLVCTADNSQGIDINNSINNGIIYIAQNIDQYGFYMFDEAAMENLSNNLDGTQLYDNSFKPNTINWYARNNKLTFLHQYTMDIFPISTLHCVLDNVTAYNNINVNGTVVIIDTEYYCVYYYNIIDNKICKHTNRSLDLTKFYDLTLDLYENRVPKNEEFIEILSKAFPENTYINYLRENGVVNFLKVLINNV